MTFKKLSEKQKKVFKWCHGKDADKYDAIVCDGAIRSGKTICMITSFVLWAMANFDGAIFAICGKTVASTERNIITPMMGIRDLTKIYKLSYLRQAHLLTVKSKNKSNYFYVFGGKDESSQDLIQGITLSGVLLDEAALMPESFVNQAIARTASVDKAKLWFNCNPGKPQHFIKTQWIDDAEGENIKRILHLHFLMEDNPTITPEQIERVKRQFVGTVFYDRYIKGLWTNSDGLVYPTFSDKNVIPRFRLRNIFVARYYVSIDYGTYNPCSMGLWAVMNMKQGETGIRIKEFYYDGRKEGVLKTDAEYYEELEKLCDGYPVESVIVDPSAASFITEIKKHGEFRVTPAKNEVIEGIRITAGFINSRRLLIAKNCKDALREFSLYVWNEKSEVDAVIKTNDHAMDDIRYFCNTILHKKITASGRDSKAITSYGNITTGGWE